MKLGTRTAVVFAGLLAATVPPAAAGAEGPCLEVPDVNDACPVWSAGYDLPERRQVGAADAQAISLSPDGSLVALTGSTLDAAGLRAATTIAYDAVSGTRRWAVRDTTPPASSIGLDVVAGRDSVFMLGRTAVEDDYLADAFIAAYDAATGTARWRRVVNGPVDALDEIRAGVLSADGGILYVGGNTSDESQQRDPFVAAYAASTGEHLWSRPVAALPEHDDQFGDLALAPGGGVVVGATEDYYGRGIFVLRSYDAEGRLRREVREQHTGPTIRGVLTDIELSRDGKLAVAVGARLYFNGASAGFRVVVFSMETGAQLWDVWRGGPWGDGVATSVAIAPDADRVFVGGFSQGAKTTPLISPVTTGTGMDQVTMAFGAATGDLRWEKRISSPGLADDAVFSLAVTPDGSRVIASGILAVADPLGGTDPANECTTLVSGRCLNVSRANLTATALAATGGAISWRTRYDASVGDAATLRDAELSADGSRLFLGGTIAATWASDPTTEPRLGYAGRFEAVSYEVPD